MENNLRIALGEDAFRNLVAGRVVITSAVASNARRQLVEIILSDIGWPAMIKAVRAAEEGESNLESPPAG